MTQPKQKGFTLVEIAVVLVIIGLLLGAILQGQQLIASARVSNLSDQQAGIQAAYFGFIDRYRAVPGDMPGDDAQSAIGVQDVSGYTGCDDDYPGGEAQGRLPAPSDTDGWCILNAVWVHLSDAGFIRGSFKGSATAPIPGNSDVSPLNSFNSPVVLARHDGYVGSQAPRLVYHFGQSVPASIARELDVKLDDGRPDTGSLRQSDTGTEPHQSDSGGGGNGGDACIGGEDDDEWDVGTNFDDCNPVFIY